MPAQTQSGDAVVFHENPPIRWSIVPAATGRADAIMIPLFSDQRASAIDLGGVPTEPRRQIHSTLALGDFKGKEGETYALGAGAIASGDEIRRIFLVGLGKCESLDADVVRWAGARACQYARKLELSRVLIHPGSLAKLNWSDFAADFAEGAILGGFAFKDYQTKTDENNPGDDRNNRPTSAQPKPVKIIRFDLIGPAEDPSMREKVSRRSAIAQAANYARFIACQPGNVVTPAVLVDLARNLARQCGLKITVIDARAAQRLGMGGLCAVGRGSAHPPSLILLEYAPPKTGRSASRQKTIAVVGKAVTFDTGGISIKPAADMGAMKYDKCGGAAVLGIMRAATALQLNHRLIGVIPVVENAVDAESYRPGDIVRMYNGKTVEISNTDAEGRLILADALAYTCEKYHPDALIDMATLTGGVVVALGGVYAGLMGNDDQLAADLIAAGQQTGEWLWRLPLHERYKKLLESPHADIQNSGAREAHPIQGGMFLREFLPKGTAWAHVDIAGVAHPKKEHRYWIADTANGFGVRLVIQYLLGNLPK